MDHYRLLYKVNGSVLSPKISKRKVAHEIRASKRSELYSSTRNISPSPQPEDRLDEQKENVTPPSKADGQDPAEGISKPEPEASVDPPSKISEKQGRQKAFVMRFLAWKAEKAKQIQLKEQQTKRAPFVVPTGATTANKPINCKKSFAPRKHVFNAPANLKELKFEVSGINSLRCINGEQQANIQFVETPKKKQCAASKVTSTVKTSHTIAAPKQLIPKPFVKKTPIPVQKTTQKALASAELKARIAPASSKKIPSMISALTPASTNSHVRLPPKSSQKSTIKPEVKPSKTPIRDKILAVRELPSKIFEKPQSNINMKSNMAPPTRQAPKINRKAPISNTSTTNAHTKTANSKSGLPALKRPNFKTSKKASTSISNAVLAIHGNARSKVGALPPTLKLNGKSIVADSKTKSTKLVDSITETPTDLNLPDHHWHFVTSTKRKSSSSKDLKADLIFAELGNSISPVDDCCPTPVEQKQTTTAKKFNFVRYSIVQPDKDKPIIASDGPAVEEGKITPEKTTGEPTTYMSPYVSVSRGKVSTKIEREKRNSIYMAADYPATPEKTTTMRHTLATVRYYRKQLMDEIARLNDQCAIWEQYKEANAQLVEDGCIDMINVTIGQTKLLTTKKLKQFGGLIDRCEDGVLGKISACIGGGDNAKPILPEDLEGFWSMVGLQIENVEKRFGELGRWKANNWTDPDAVPTKTTNDTATVKRTKKRKPAIAARPNGALQKMLRTAHAAYLNKKAVGGADEDIILTPSKSRQVVIRDRRSRSAAATVITFNTPRMSRKSHAFETPPSVINETPKLLPHINGFRKSLNLLKSTLMSEQERTSPGPDNDTPLRQPGISRKSILKTPGSKSRPKSVIFNSPTLKFTIEDTVDEVNSNSNEDQEEEDQRTYKLRNRRIVLRDSAEFVIPK